MPTYGYECEKCHHEFERLQSMADKAVKKCPKCKGRVKRLLGGGSGIIFKGSGFYGTDYRSKKYQDAAKKDKESKEKPPDSSKAKPAKDGSAKKD